MDEEFELILHATNETGPYPNDFTGASFGEFLDVKWCDSDGSEYYIRCGGAGNDLDKVEVFKMSMDGSRKLVASSSEVNRYEINVGVGLSPRTDLGGTCAR
ncbi:uncharacterized protein [Littorina saxatilis]|uniref:uncharacterized protein n=1 Tax=Littorina saxatilis TaxID=31220 RepID=UPI0038B697DA